MDIDTVKNKYCKDSILHPIPARRLSAIHEGTKERNFTIC